MEKERNSNFDLLKIISMLMIILWHFLIHGKILDNTIGNLHKFLMFVMNILVVHVNSFVLVTGYFQYKKNFKLSKIFSLNNAVWFYKTLILLIFISFGLQQFSDYEIFKNLMPFNYNDYWFIMIYTFLYLCSPLLNIIIEKISKKQYQFLLFIMFFIISFLATISNQEIFNNGNGYSLVNFVFLYFIGAYISKYGIKNLEKNNKYTMLYLFILIICNTGITYYFQNLTTTNFYLIRLQNSIIGSKYGYATPFVILQSILYFYIFKNLHIKSKILRYISSTTIGIYLIHDNVYVRNYIYLNVFKLDTITLYSKNILPKLAIYVVITFVICMLIEIVRKYIFKTIYKLLLSNIIRNKIAKIVIKNDIDWN